jgi:putative membrane protein
MFASGYCGGMGVAGWLVMIAFWGGFIALVLWAVTRLFPTSDRGGEAVELLDRRLATGQIDAETYRQVRDELADAGRP